MHNNMQENHIQDIKIFLHVDIKSKQGFGQKSRCGHQVLLKQFMSFSPVEKLSLRSFKIQGLKVSVCIL